MPAALYIFSEARGHALDPPSAPRAASFGSRLRAPAGDAQDHPLIQTMALQEPRLTRAELLAMEHPDRTRATPTIHATPSPAGRWYARPSSVATPSPKGRWYGLGTAPERGAASGWTGVPAAAGPPETPDHGRPVESELDALMDWLEHADEAVLAAMAV